MAEASRTQQQRDRRAADPGLQLHTIRGNLRRPAGRFSAGRALFKRVAVPVEVNTEIFHKIAEPWLLSRRSSWGVVMNRRHCLVLLACVVLPGIALGQYVSSDTYTRYELLAPESHQFRIYYEVTETRAGARFHFNVIREGSEASDESVIDLVTGKPLRFEVVSGTAAKADAPHENFNPAGKYIKVHLTHPVPAKGEYRLAIVKTYRDEKSYYPEGNSIVFKRSLSIPRNGVVLPAGYEIDSCSVAAQVISEPDGRLKLAFMNAGSGGALEVAIKARPLPAALWPASGTP